VTNQEAAGIADPRLSGSSFAFMAASFLIRSIE
jgi:hypothetical protein